MKFLWVNNVCNIMGGTLNCTLSMLSAFPDCDHTVFCFSGVIGPEEDKAFPKEVKLVVGPNVKDFIGNDDYDVIVYQNTGDERLPHFYPNKPLTIYYLHSHHSSGIRAMNRCDISLCVSTWLADTADLPRSKVLHQPVTIPQRISDEEKARYDEWAHKYDYVLGRICTPNPKKWQSDDVVNLVGYINDKIDDNTGIGWHFIGCPEWVRKDLEVLWTNCYFTDPSFSARGYLHEWQYLVYKSGLTESFGRVVREAQRCGCIPIVSNSGGFREQIQHGKTGFLCSTNEDFLEALGTGIPAIQTEEGSLSLFRNKFLGVLKNHYA